MPAKADPVAHNYARNDPLPPLLRQAERSERRVVVDTAHVVRGACLGDLGGVRWFVPTGTGTAPSAP